MYMKMNTTVSIVDGASRSVDTVGEAGGTDDKTNRAAAFQELLSSDKWMRFTEAKIDKAVEDLRTFENGAKFISLYDRDEYPQQIFHFVP